LILSQQKGRPPNAAERDDLVSTLEQSRPLTAPIALRNGRSAQVSMRIGDHGGRSVNNNFMSTTALQKANVVVFVMDATLLAREHDFEKADEVKGTRVSFLHSAASCSYSFYEELVQLDHAPHDGTPRPQSCAGSAREQS
jgi:hypothetical protein